MSTSERMNPRLPLLGLLLPLVSFAADEPRHPFAGSIERLDPAFDKLVAADAKIEKLAEWFVWSEGPTWFEGAVVFSDVMANTAYRWKEGMPAAEVFLKPSGLTASIPGIREPGSNGLAVDRSGRLLLCQHGERRIARLEKDGSYAVVADRFEGKRFHSPNDLALNQGGDIYFTDPPYGLEKIDDSPLKEQAFHGVYRVAAADGKVTLLTREIMYPNGIAFSPDQKILYVASSDSRATRVMAHDVAADGTIANARVLFDAQPLRKSGVKGSCDGLKVDRDGNLWATGPGGVLVISPAGKLLGRINTNEATGNCCWGDDGSTLYITADMFLVRVKTLTKGAGW